MGQQSISQWPDHGELDPRGSVTRECVVVVHRPGLCRAWGVAITRRLGRAQLWSNAWPWRSDDEEVVLSRRSREMLGFGETKVRMAIIHGDLRSVKDGKLRRILPEWVDDYVALRVTQSDQDVA